jgi:hypothetical protein
MRYLTSQLVNDNKHFYLNVPFYKDNRQIHLSLEEIKRLVRNYTTLTQFIDGAARAAKCSALNLQATRTRLIRDLLKHVLEIFLDKA